MRSGDVGDYPGQPSGVRFNNVNALKTGANNPLTTGFHIGIWQINQGHRYDAAKWYVNGIISEIWDSSTNPAHLTAFQDNGNVLQLGNGRGGTPSDWYNDWYGGDLAELLVYNRQLTVSEIAAIGRYWSEKYNLQR